MTTILVWFIMSLILSCGTGGRPSSLRHCSHFLSCVEVMLVMVFFDVLQDLVVLVERALEVGDVDDVVGLADGLN